MEEEIVQANMTMEQAELIRLLLSSPGYQELKRLIEKEIEESRAVLENVGNERDDDMIKKGAIHAMRWVLGIANTSDGVIVRAEEREKKAEGVEQTETIE